MVLHCNTNHFKCRKSECRTSSSSSAEDEWKVLRTNWAPTGASNWANDLFDKIEQRIDGTALLNRMRHFSDFHKNFSSVQASMVNDETETCESFITNWWTIQLLIWCHELWQTSPRALKVEGWTLKYSIVSHRRGVSWDSLFYFWLGKHETKKCKQKKNLLENKKKIGNQEV